MVARGLVYVNCWGTQPWSPPGDLVHAQAALSLQIVAKTSVIGRGYSGLPGFRGTCVQCCGDETIPFPLEIGMVVEEHPRCVEIEEFQKTDG